MGHRDEVAGPGWEEGLKGGLLGPLGGGDSCGPWSFPGGWLFLCSRVWEFPLRPTVEIIHGERPDHADFISGDFETDVLSGLPWIMHESVSAAEKDFLTSWPLSGFMGRSSATRMVGH